MKKSMKKIFGALLLCATAAVSLTGCGGYSDGNATVTFNQYQNLFSIDGGKYDGAAGVYSKSGNVYYCQDASADSYTITITNEKKKLCTIVKN